MPTCSITRVMDQHWALVVLLSFDEICCFALFCLFCLLAAAPCTFHTCYGVPDAAKSKQTNSSLAEHSTLALPPNGAALGTADASRDNTIRDQTINWD